MNPYIESVRNSPTVPALDAMIASLADAATLPWTVRFAMDKMRAAAARLPNPEKGVRRFLEQNDATSAFTLAWLTLNGKLTTPSWLLFVLGATLLQSGYVKRGRAVFRAFRDDEFTRDDPFFPPAVHQAFYESIAFNNEKIASIQQVDTWLGRYDSPGLAERRIGSFLEEVFARAEAGHDPWQPVPLPSFPPEALPARPRILLLEVLHINCDERCPRLNMTPLLLNSARKFAEVAFQAGDRLLYDLSDPERCQPRWEGQVYHKSPELRAEEIARLEAVIREFRPDVLVADLSFTPTANTLQPGDLQSFRERYGLRVAGLLWDDYYGWPVDPGVWNEAVDSMGTWNYFHSRGNASKHFPKYFSTSPLGRSDDEAVPEKSVDFVFAGSSARYRRAWLTAMQESGLSCEIFFQRKQIDQRFKTDSDYLDQLRRGKITFNTGYYQKNVSILTGCPAEAVQSRCLLMEEEGSPLHHFLQPYIHYIPVRTVHELVHFSRFFCLHEDWRRRVVDAAHDYCARHYPPSAFWNRLLGMTLRPDLAPPRQPRVF